MQIPEHARTLIAQTVSQSIAAMGYRIQDAELEAMVEKIQEVLNAGGYVVLSQDDLAQRIDDGSEPDNYEDGQ